MYISHFVLICTVLCKGNFAVKREYFVGLVEEEWNYAPKGNLLHKHNKNSKVYLSNDPNIPVIGTKYIKAMYREFNDSTFMHRKEQPNYMGILGPFIHGEEDDTIVVHFRNFAKNHSYSMHPHGVFYNKENEGSVYLDGTSGKAKSDDAVPPGGSYTYVWTVHPEYAPTIDDPSCITWLLHSHNVPEAEVMAGAISIMATCKKGTLNLDGTRKDVDREYPLLFMIFDENASILLNHNIETYLPGIDETKIKENEDKFKEGNEKFSINGYIYGNLQGLEACEGEKISFHIAVAGNDEDTHSIYFQGHNMIIHHNRMDTVGAYPGSSITALLSADNPGSWLVASQNVLFQEAGMQTLFTVNRNCSKGENLKFANTSTVRHYYIAAEEHWWEYAPLGHDVVSGIPLNKHRVASQSFSDVLSNDTDKCKLNGKYKKALFRAYTDSQFKERIPHPSHLGILGHPIKAEVGDTVIVHFYNNASRNFSIQPYRFYVNYNESGIQYDGGPDVAVQPGNEKVYTWKIPDSVGPTSNDPDCLFGRYYSAVDAVADTYSGLMGPVVVCRRGTLNTAGENTKVDKEFYLMLSNFNEHYSHYFAESILEACPEADYKTLISDEDFIKANIMRSLNGRIYGNLEGLTMTKGDKVNWYVMSVGSGLDDIHSPHFHGNTFNVYGATKDTVTLTADIFQTLYMIPDNPGIWSLEDQVTQADQQIVQMNFLYEVKDHSGNDHKKEEIPTRIYYIATVEREWDYAPVDIHPITGKKLSEDESSKLYYNNNPENNLIGHKYKKALFREFTDDTFRQEKMRTEKESHLGILGPLIKAEVGEKIRVVFKNMASYNFSIVPHGVLYDKANEGYFYNDSVSRSQKMGDYVRPQEMFTYEWDVPERAGPSPQDFNCTTWAYTSHVDYTRDIYSTLIGPLIICRQGVLKEANERSDVQEEFALLLFINSEGASHYINDNIQTYLHKEPSKEILEDPNFITANDKYTINGYIYGNVPNITMSLGSKVAWYILSLGDTRSTHSVHWHGNTFIERKSGIHRHDVLSALPGDFETVEMVTTNVGEWLMHCHVNDHSELGMTMVYSVVDPAQQLR